LFQKATFEQPIGIELLEQLVESHTLVARHFGGLLDWSKSNIMKTVML